MDTKARIEEVIEGLEYSAEFVPFSQSRNANTGQPSFNWIVTLKANGVKLVTDYMQGIGHHPHYNRECKDKWLKEKAIQKSTETGKLHKAFDSAGGDGARYLLFYGMNHPKKNRLPVPDIKDVLYSLVVDSEVLEYGGFEDWVPEFGFDPDSRTAEKTYQDCLQNALKMRRMFGDSGLEELREYFQDY